MNVNMIVLWCLVTQEMRNCPWYFLCVDSLIRVDVITHSINQFMHSLSFAVHRSGWESPSIPGWVRKTAHQFQDGCASPINSRMGSVDTRTKRSSYGQWIPAFLLRCGLEWTPTGVSLAIPVYACVQSNPLILSIHLMSSYLINGCMFKACGEIVLFKFIVCFASQCTCWVVDSPLPVYLFLGDHWWSSLGRE